MNTVLSTNARSYILSNYRISMKVTVTKHGDSISKVS